MRRDGVDYMRCMECDAVLESDDLEQAPADLDLDGEAEPATHAAHLQRKRKKAS